MRIYITVLPSGYQVEHLARVFFPGAQLLVEKPDGKDRGDLIRAHCGKKHHWAALRQNGRVYTRRVRRSCCCSFIRWRRCCIAFCAAPPVCARLGA